jgi:hypothetical protein
MYCTYLTVYSGNKLPPFYIGSTSIKSILEGYRGSVSSKRYSRIWKQELKDNPILFKTFIISRHDSRQDAVYKEYKLQKILNVVKSDMYMNLSLASKDGCFGRDMKWINNPMHGMKLSIEAKDKISKSNSVRKVQVSDKLTFKGCQHSEESKLKMKEAHKAREGHQPFKDRKHSEETLTKMRESRSSESNPNFGKKWWHNKDCNRMWDIPPDDSWSKGIDKNLPYHKLKLN